MTDHSLQEVWNFVFSEGDQSPDALIELALVLPESLLKRAIVVARAIPDPVARAYVLRNLSARFKNGIREKLLRESLDAAWSIKDPIKRTSTIIDLAKFVSRDDRLKILVQLEMLVQLEQAAKRVDEPVARSKALECLEVPSDYLDKDPDHEYQKLRHIPKSLPGLNYYTAYSDDDTLKGRINKLSGSERNDLAREIIARLQTRVVNTGFASKDKADECLEKNASLQSGKSYYFCLEVGRYSPQSIEETPTALPDSLPAMARLKVTVSGFIGELETTTGADVGEIELQTDGTAIVIKNLSPPPDIEQDSDLIKRRLFFPIRTPNIEGTFRLRCNIYYEQILVQSRLVYATVNKKPQIKPGALISKVDYSIASTLLPAHLTRLAPHRLSLLLNSNGDGTHTLSFFGANEGELFKAEARIVATNLVNPIDMARKALMKASWGDDKPWEKGKNYRYNDSKLDRKRLEEDLTDLAIRGYILYNGIINTFTGPGKGSKKLAHLMHNPGFVQIAIKDSPTQVLPAALLYDYNVDTTPKQPSKNKICESFMASLDDDEPLDKAPCFNGGCPHSEIDKPDGYICPSGFWGFRHNLGLPVSVPYGRDQPAEIMLDGPPQIVVGVATNLDQVEDHVKSIKQIRADLGWHYSADRTEVLSQLSSKIHLAYFYCHGGVKNSIPYLQLGSGDDFIEGSNLRAYSVEWDEPQPLVFINGCHTTAMDPMQSINLVQDFMGAGGAGVIGTEITVFESLARSFSEECLRIFLTTGLSIGEAIRIARLGLLKKGNPLGLVYTPFVLPSLHIMEKKGGG